MKYEKLDISSGSKYKWLLCGIIIGVLLIIIVNFIFSYAKYKSVDSVKLASGTINYESADLNVIAMYKKDDDNSEYQAVNEIPTSGYIIDNSMSYCKEPGTVAEIKGILNYNDGILSLKYSKKGTKCYLFFKKPKTPAEQTLAQLFNGFITAETGTNFSRDETTGVLKITGIDDGDNGNTLYKAEDNDGTSYFFRGQAKNNWVRFANMRWRIVRINGDGTIRMIFQCSGTDCKDMQGEKTQINENTKAYKNSPINDNAYVGYYYGKASATSYEDTHKSLSTNPSTIADSVNKWYISSGLSDYEQYIDPDAGFCNDRQVVTGVNSSYDSGTGVGTSVTSYAAWGRIYKNNSRIEQLPTLKCGVSVSTADEQETSVEVDEEAYARDLFTKSGSKKGNRILQYPIGLITADEVLLAGGYYGTANLSYYLYTNKYYWTLSPSNLGSDGYARVFDVSDSGGISYDYVSNTNGVRPVINLKANTTFSEGTGTVDDPFVVATN